MEKTFCKTSNFYHAGLKQQIKKKINKINVRCLHTCTTMAANKWNKMFLFLIYAYRLKILTDTRTGKYE